MDANWNNPTTGSNYLTEFIPEVKNRDEDCAVQFDSELSSPTNIPTGTKRWNSTSYKWQQWNGAAWEDLAATYGIDVDTLDGWHKTDYQSDAQGKVDTHAGVTTSVHGSTSDKTASKIIERDIAGRAKVVDGSAADDIATVNNIDSKIITHNNVANAHGAATAATASTMIYRDTNARAKVADPSASGDIDTKGARDTAISTHNSAGSAHSASAIGLGSVTNDKQAKELFTSYDEKTTLADDDLLIINDSADTNKIKKVKKSNLGAGGGGIGPVRQTVLSSILSSGLPSFISIGSGLSVNIDGDPTPVVISFAYGFDSSGPVDKIGLIDSDNTISSLAANATNYLYAERDISTGDISLKSTTKQPQYSNAYGVSMISRILGTAIGTMTGYGGVAGSFDGVINTGYASSNASVLQGSGSLTGYVGKDWGSGVTKIIAGFKVYGASDLTGYTNSTNKSVTVTLQGSTDNFASSIVDLYSESITPTSVSWIYSVMSGITTTTGYRYHRVKLVENSGDGGSHTIAITEIEFYENDGFTFSIPEHTMYSWSGSEWEEKQIVFLGEAITDGSSVTSVVNYALRGRYDSGDITTTATATTKYHNIGVDFAKTTLLEGSAGARSQIMSKDFTSISKTGITWSAVAGTSRLIVERGF